MRFLVDDSFLTEMIRHDLRYDHHTEVLVVDETIAHFRDVTSIDSAARSENELFVPVNSEKLAPLVGAADFLALQSYSHILPEDMQKEIYALSKPVNSSKIEGKFKMPKGISPIMLQFIV